MTNYERIYDRDDPVKVLLRMVGDNPLWKGSTIVLIDEDEGSNWYWGMFADDDDRFHGINSLLSDLMEMSLSHRIIQIGVQTDSFSVKPKVDEIRLRFSRIEGSGLSENVTPELVDVLYGLLKTGWSL